MKQTARILKQLERGPVNSVDFAAPACDGGQPVMRVAARVHELQACGYKIRSDRQLNGTVTYTLVDIERSDDGLTAPRASSPQAPPTVVASLGVALHPTRSDSAHAADVAPGPLFPDEHRYRDRDV